MAEDTGWIYLGSSADCDIQITGQDISAYHARCRIEAGSRVRIQDLGSTTGIAVNKPGNRTVSQFLASSDTVFVGNHPVPAARIFEKLLPGHNGHIEIQKNKVC